MSMHPIGLAALFALASAVAAPSAEAQSPRERMIVSDAWVAEHLNDPTVVLLHVGDKAEYDREHLPGARYVPLRETAAPHIEGQLHLELPPAAQMRERLAALGISDDSRIVLYWGKDWITPTTRIYLTLDYLGLGDRTAILDGGMQLWKKNGRPVTAELPAITPGRLSARPTKDVIVRLADVKAASAGKKGVRIIDARAPVFYDGNDGPEGRAGHIPGAISLPYDRIADENAVILGDTALAERFRAAGVRPGDTIIAYCHIGQQATAIVFAARLLGYEAKLYDGSYDEWGGRTTLPVALPDHD